jgi:hypothetical protein
MDSKHQLVRLVAIRKNDSMEDFMTMYHLELEEERHCCQKEREIMRQQREQEVS